MHFRRTILLITVLQTVTGTLMAQQTRMPQLSYDHPWSNGDGGPGFSEQPNVHSSRAIKSFQKLSGFFNNKIIKQAFEGRAAMVFNAQEPLFSNPSQRDSKQNGTSLMGGYFVHTDYSGSENINDNSLSFGINLSRRTLFGKHLEWEMIVSIYNSPEHWAGQMQVIDSIVDFARVKGSVLYYELAKLNSIDIMPVKISYRLSEFLSISTGSLILFNFITHSSSQQTKYFLQSDFPIPPVTVKKEIPASEWYRGSDMAVFADMQMGSVKAGPALGIRFMHCFNGPPYRLFCYACWRL
jgi:hypothetical protein